MEQSLRHRHVFTHRSGERKAFSRIWKIRLPPPDYSSMSSHWLSDGGRVPGPAALERWCRDPFIHRVLPSMRAHDAQE
jgi:hypothetical protein